MTTQECREWEALRKKALTIALKEYATEASSIIRLTRGEITSIIEEASVDPENLSRLISIVDDASQSNNQKVKLLKNTPGLIEVVVPLIRRLLG